jgi:hypothetical protein
MTQNERFGLVFAKTGSINSGTDFFNESVSPGPLSTPLGPFRNFTKNRSVISNFIFIVVVKVFTGDIGKKLKNSIFL